MINNKDKEKRKNVESLINILSIKYPNNKQQIFHDHKTNINKKMLFKMYLI